MEKVIDLKFDELYIPIWFYSNSANAYVVKMSMLLYIPIWFYSNTLNSFVSLASLNFTFQSGSIQIVQALQDRS